MVMQGKRRISAALGATAIAVVAVLGGTSYAASRPSHPSASSHHALSKSEVKKLVKSYAISGHGGLYFDAKGLRAGRYTVTVVAVDLAGNKSRARTLRLTVR